MTYRYISFIFLGLALVVGAYLVFQSLSSSGSANDNQTALNQSNSNQLAGVLPVIFTGKQVNYDQAFGQPDTSAWSSYCIGDTKCFKYDPSYTLCPSSIGNTEAYYLLHGACEGNQDAPLFVIQKLLDPGEQPTIEPGYTFDLEQKVPIQDQVQSDEITGTAHGRDLTCYDTKINRECKVTFSDGSSYSLDGRDYNNANYSTEDMQHTRNAFDGIVRSLLESSSN